MNFVWTYWHEGAKEDELRWSIRSTLHHFPDSKITVIGNPPEWYTGHQIFRLKIPETRAHNAHDVIEKIKVVMNHPEIDETFTWMMDDIYFLNSCSIEDLTTPRASLEPVSFVNMKFKKWKKLKFNTFEALRASGLWTYDYATHLPQVFEKEKLKKVFEIFDVETSPLLWEVLYGNLFRTLPIDCRPFLHSQRTPVTLFNAEFAAQNSIVLNHGNQEGWTQELRNWLALRYPSKSKVEQ